MKTDNQKSLEAKWAQQAAEFRAAAEKLPAGPHRDALLKTARQLGTASEMEKWLSSPGLQPPAGLDKFRDQR